MMRKKSFSVLPEAKKFCFTESDINELAQAKGANAAGLHVVFNKYGIRFDDVDVFYLAGGFGRHLDVESSKRIGLIPNIDSAKILQVGNASIEGACIALLSRSKRYGTGSPCQKSDSLPPGNRPEFFRLFCRRMSVQSDRPLNVFSEERS